jgi:hypothetical protein
MDETLSRAFSAYFKIAKREGYSADQPSESRSGEDVYDGKRYVVLRNGSGVLAVYRVRNDGMLKRLRRWPAHFGESTSGGYRDEWRTA